VRHLYVYRFTYLIAALLVAAAALFAWLRSQDSVAVPEEPGHQRLYQLPPTNCRPAAQVTPGCSVPTSVHPALGDG
jgi:hypothetical protein